VSKASNIYDCIRGDNMTIVSQKFVNIYFLLVVFTEVGAGGGGGAFLY
jgi:hypothetical protein